MDSFTPGEHVPAGDQRAAGVVVVRRSEGRLQAALIHRPHRSDWSLPKGKLEHGESFEEAALRETYEETGLHGELLELLGTSEYEHRSGRAKVVAVYLMAYQAGEFRVNEEADDLRWCDEAEARSLATFERDADLLALGLSRAEALDL